MSNLKIIFAGTPQFAVPTLQNLIDRKTDIKAVYTQPDRPQGRGQKLAQSPVKQLAEQFQLPIEQPLNFKTDEALDTLKSYQPDVMIVVAYGLILPKSVLEIPKLGCINIHPSLLPLYRGALPIQQAILNGDQITGVTIMKMDVGMDSGPILLQQTLDLTGQETAASLSLQLAKIGAEMIGQILEQMAQQCSIKEIEQDHTLATYTQKLSKEKALMDWSKPAVVLHREIRAFNPWPISYTQFQEQIIRVWNAEIVSENQPDGLPGTILKITSQGLEVLTGQGVLRLTEIQLAGKKPAPLSVLLNGYPHLFTTGQIFS